MIQNNIMDTDKIGKLLFDFSIPATIGIFVVALYNIIDSIFVGNFIGTQAIAGLTVSAPIQTIVIGFGIMIGVGATSLLSRSLGAKDYVTVNKILGNVIFLIITTCSTISIIAYIFLTPILYSFGATESIIQYAQEYMQIILTGILFLITSIALNNLIRAEGKAKIAMYTMLIGAFSNIILDTLFIVVFKWGVRGAALATVIAHILTAIFLFYFIISDRSIMKFKIKNIRPDKQIIFGIYSIGIAAFIRTSAISFISIIFNRKFAQLGGYTAIAVYGILIRVITIISTPLIGIAQGMQPIAGFNYGAKNYLRLKKTFQFSFISSTIFALAGSLFLYYFPQQIIQLFSKDIELLRIGEEALKMMVVAFPLIGFYIVNSTIYQALGMPIPNFILSISRQVLFLFPAALLLSKYFGLTGMWIAFPVSDFLGAVLSLLFYWSLSKDLFKENKEDTSKA